MGQMSFFSADAHPRAVTDLEGVLCARGQLSVFGRGTTARLSIVLGSPPVVPADGEPEDGEPENGEPGNDELEDGEPGNDEHGDAVQVGPVGDRDEDGPDHDGRGSDTDADHHGVDHHGPDHREADDHRAFDDPPFDVPRLDVPRLDATRDDGLPHDQATAVLGGPPPTVDPVAEWRAHALCCAFRTRGVDAEVDRLDDGRPVVRSAYRADLVPLAGAWTRGAIKAVPSDFELDGPRLRLWVLAAGRQHGPAYLLGLDPHAPGAHQLLLAASTRAGLGATLGGDRAEPVLRIVGRRRQARLAELIGDRPRSLADGIWPG